MAGWYYCACSQGYQSVIMYPTSDYMSTTDASDLEVLEPTLSPFLGTMCQGEVIYCVCIYNIVYSY